MEFRLPCYIYLFDEAIHMEKIVNELLILSDMLKISDAQIVVKVIPRKGPICKACCSNKNLTLHTPDSGGAHKKCVAVPVKHAH